MNYDVMDLDKEYWIAMMIAFWTYDTRID